MENRISLLIILFSSALLALLYYINRRRKHLNRELRKVSEMKTKFFSNISHEFRTPLTLIKGPVERVYNSDIPSDIRPDLEIVLRNVDHLLFLVNRILNFSKIEAGKFEVKCLEGNLSDDIKSLAESFLFQATEKNINYSVNVKDSGQVWYDPEILKMLMNNLLSNAFKYSPEGGFVKCIGERKGHLYEITFVNTAKSIVKENLSRFFERFYSSAAVYEVGTGIGLSLVKELCSLYKAQISMGLTQEKNGDNVVEFKLKLPIDKQDFSEKEIVIDIPHENTKPIELNGIDKQDFSKDTEDLPWILIVEDNVDMRHYLRSCFKELCHIIEAVDGREGIDKAIEFVPDIIVSDIMMPNINGLELCETLKTNYATNHIPIILLSALDEEKTILEGLKNKADDYIVKPFNSQMLIAKVSNLINTRNILRTKYREEIIVKPFGLLLNNKDTKFAEILKEVLENHISNPEFEVDDFCKIAGMSRSQLHRKLKALTDLSTSAFIRVHRVKFASELLKKKEYNISDVCFASGFNDTSYFSRAFKDVTGLTPIDYRKSFQN